MDREWKILLIDDDEEDYLLTRIMLSAARGARITLEWARSYESGQAALRDAGPFNAVLVDYDLGLYSGIDLIKEFTRQGYPAPFILFTGRGTYEVDIQAMDAGTTLYLTKAEANSLLLERVIRYAIERKQNEEALRQANEELSRVNAELVEQLAERERAERATQESQKKYRDLVENLSEGVWVVDEAGDTVYINRQMADMLGYSVEEMTGKNQALFLQEDGSLDVAEDMERRKRGLKEQFERTFTSKDGYPVHTLLTTGPIFTDGKFAGAISGVLDITDRRRINQVLIENEERFRSTIESMLDGVAIFSTIRQTDEATGANTIADFCYEYINQKGCQLENNCLENLVGRRLFEMNHYLTKGENFQRLVKVVESGEPAEFRYELGKDGAQNGNTEVKIYEVRAYKLGDGLAVTWRDTTALEEVAERLLKSEKKAREQLSEIENIYRSAPVGMCFLDRDLRFLRINDKLADINGIPAEAHIGARVHEQLPGIADQVERIVRQITETGKAVLNVEIHGETPAQPGVQRDWLEHWLPIFNSAGELVSINVVAEEITERKQAEKALQASGERNRDLIEKLSFHIENAPLAAVEWDADFKITMWSVTAENIFGWTEEEVLGKSFMDLNLVYEEDIPIVNRVLAQLSDGSSTRVISANRNLTKDGQVIYCEWYNSVLYDQDGQMKSMLSLAQDVTEREHARLQLQLNAAQLQQSNLALEQFAYVASHDLQEPLRKIRSFSTQLAKHYGDVLGPEGQDWLDRMCSAAQRMEEMITSLLEYARVTSQERRFAMVDLTEAARQAMDILDVRVQQAHGVVHIDPLPTIRADPDQMRQLLQNLIGNSLKFTRKGVAPQVKVSSRQSSPDTVEIRVEDNGIGFDPRQAGKLFQPFQRLHGHSEYEGTGIGLAICQKIVERHGGTISAESRVGEGSTFTVTLPVQGPAS